MTLDHPHVRDSHTCIVCLKQKPIGNVLCWKCYRERDVKQGNPLVEMLLDTFEAKLAERVR